MLIDTDILIWALRGNPRAAEAIDAAQERYISVINYMELLQGARNKKELRLGRSFLLDLGFSILPLTEKIGHRASIYMEDYVLKAGLCVADALLAATAVERQLALFTGNAKHYRPIAELEVKAFRL